MNLKIQCTRFLLTEIVNIWQIVYLLLETDMGPDPWLAAKDNFCAKKYGTISQDPRYFGLEQQ